MSAVIGQILAGGAGSLVESVGKVIDDLTTSDKERMDAELRSQELDNQIALAQLEVGKAEAQHASLFVAGGRPFIIWVCGVALASYYIPKALVLSAVWVYAAVRVTLAWNGLDAFPALPAYPDIGVADLIGLVFALLGLSVQRHRETMAGTARAEPLTPFKLPNPFSRKPAEQEAP